MAAKNFLMISIDDMDGQQLGALHLTPLIRTPHMDRLAEMGTTFERAVTQVSAVQSGAHQRPQRAPAERDRRP